MVISVIAIFILGTIIGSFLNVVILRYNTGRTINGRSGCMLCGYQLKWYDLIPVFSWIFLSGKCRKCKAKISIQYPLVELATGLLFLALFIDTAPLFNYPELAMLSFVFNAVIFSFLIIIFVYDLYHKIIPDRWSYTFAVLVLIRILLLTPLGEGFDLISVLDLFSGLIMFIPFFLLWYLSKGRWIGLGDGKLALGIGWYLGFVYGLSAIILAFWIGAVFSIVILLIDRLRKSNENITMKTEIPFAPFLIIGTIIEFFWRTDLIGVSLFLF